MADISKEELEKEIAKILENANLASTSSKKVRQKLEESFGVDLTKKRKIIDQLVMDYVNNKEDDASDDEEEEEEEDDKKLRKRAAPKVKTRKETSVEDEADNGSDSDEKPAPKKKGRKKKGSDDEDDWNKKKKATKTKKAGGRGKGGGYTRAYKLSPALAELMGEDEMARHEVVKRVWAIIKEKKLYDPNNKQFAICDDALYKADGHGEESSFTRAYKLSPALAELMGKGEMSRPEVISRIFAIIKENKLHDPNNIRHLRRCSLQGNRNETLQNVWYDEVFEDTLLGRVKSVEMLTSIKEVTHIFNLHTKA